MQNKIDKYYYLDIIQIYCRITLSFHMLVLLFQKLFLYFKIHLKNLNLMMQ